MIIGSMGILLLWKLIYVTHLIWCLDRQCWMLYLHFPELLLWSTWCYGQYPILWHTVGSITSESGVQQGDPLGPLLFCLVLHQVVCATATDSECASLLFHRWYIDDGVVAGPITAVLCVLSIIKDLGPPLGLHINLSKCELFSVNDLSRFPDEMKKLAQEGSSVPHVAMLLLRQCGGFCRLIHLARTIPPSLAGEALSLFDDEVRQCSAMYCSIHSWLHVAASTT